MINRTAYDARALGAKCDICPFNNGKPVPPQRSVNPRLSVLVESPGETESVHRTPLVGKAGRTFDRILELDGIPRDSLHIDHAVACRPLYNAKPSDWKLALECCRPRLAAELPPGVPVLALGDRSQQTLSGKAKLLDWMGPPSEGVIWSNSGKVWTPGKKKLEPDEGAIRFDRITWLSTFSPGYCLGNPQYTPILRKHIRRAWDLATRKLTPWKWPSESVDNDAGAVDFLCHLKNTARRVVCDTETNKNAKARRLLNVGFSNHTHSVSITWETATQRMRELCGQILADPEITKEFWNMAFDIPILEQFGMPVVGPVEDWMHAFNVIAPRVSHKLTHASCFELNVPRWKTTFHASKEAGLDEFESADPFDRSLYNGRDCFVTYELGSLYPAYLKETHRGEELYANAIANTKLAIKMKSRGVKISRENVAARTAELKPKLAQATKTLVDICAQLGFADFNPASHPQRAKLFEETLGVRIPRKKDKASLDKKALEDFCAHDDPRVRTVSRSILEVRSAKKKLDYLAALNEDVIHCDWKPGRAITGRWGSANVNLQNIPKPVKDPQTKEVKDAGLRICFESRLDMVLVECDYAALEARILALIAGDARLLDWFNTGVDIHTRTAALALGKKDNEVSKDEREIAKGLRYAFHYGSTPETAWKQNVIKIPSLTLRMVDILFSGLSKLHPDIIRYHQAVVGKARRDDFVEDGLSGRRHYFHGQIDVNQCYNLPIQTFASSLIDGAMRRLSARLDPDEHLLMQVHDSLVCEGPDPIALGRKIVAEMESPITLNGQTIVFSTDAKSGQNWGQMKTLVL